MQSSDLNNVSRPIETDVLCIGNACYDLTFSIAQHPRSDEKIFADHLVGCGGGPAANAAIAVSRLGMRSAFAGYLGQDLYGDMHLQELIADNVDIHLLVRQTSPTPLSTILVKPDGKRALINYKGATKPLLPDAIEFSTIKPKAVLFDGHEPNVSLVIIESADFQGIPSILDAGSMHEGTSKLWNQVDYLVASEKFALQFAGDAQTALARLAVESPAVVITLGENGLIWQCGSESGSLMAFAVDAIDTTGAGDAFHGAFSAAIAAGMSWNDTLVYSSAAGALCCTQIGARQGLPWESEHRQFIELQVAKERSCTEEGDLTK